MHGDRNEERCQGCFLCPPKSSKLSFLWILKSRSHVFDTIICILPKFIFFCEIAVFVSQTHSYIPMASLGFTLRTFTLMSLPSISVYVCAHYTFCVLHVQFSVQLFSRSNCLFQVFSSRSWSLLGGRRWQKWQWQKAAVQPEERSTQGQEKRNCGN